MARRVKEPSDELGELLGRSSDQMAAALLELTRAQLSFDQGKIERAQRKVGNIIAGSQRLADVLGRRRLILEARKSAQFAARREDNPIFHNVTFGEALEDIASRDPILARSQEEIMTAYSEDHGFAMARSSSIQLTKKVQNVIASAIRRGKPAPDAIGIIDAMGDWVNGYAQTVFRTNVTTAYSAGRFRQAQSEELRDVIGGLRYDAILDPDVRKNHKAADGLIAATDDPIWDTLSPPLGFNCFVPGTRVSGRFLAGSKAWYSGPVVQIETQNGCRFSVTVNHPVLASTGWTPAGRLQKGDDLVAHLPTVESLCHGSRDRTFAFVPMGGRAVYDQNAPPRIEQVFDSLWTHRTRSICFSARVRSMDFHGDAEFFKGDIDVVGTDIQLTNRIEIGKHRADQRFVFSGSESRSSYCGGIFNPSVHRFWSSSDSIPSGTALSLDDSFVVRTGFSLTPFQEFGFGFAANLNVVSDENARQNSSADPGFLRQLFHAGSGEVSFDRIIKVTYYGFSGHVYDLQSKGGWIVSEGIFTSNCRCTVEHITFSELKEKRMILKDGSIKRARIPRGAGPDKGFQSPGRPDRQFYS